MVQDQRKQPWDKPFASFYTLMLPILFSCHLCPPSLLARNSLACLPWMAVDGFRKRKRRLLFNVRSTCPTTLTEQGTTLNTLDFTLLKQPRPPCQFYLAPKSPLLEPPDFAAPAIPLQQGLLIPRDPQVLFPTKSALQDRANKDLEALAAP